MGAADEGLGRDHEQDRQRKQHQQQPGIAIHRERPFQGQPEAGQERAEQGRAVADELRADEIGQFAQMDEIAAPVRVVGRVLDGREIIGRVPEDVGQQEDDRDDGRGEPFQRQHCAACGRVECDGQAEADHEVDHRVFGKEAEADRQAQSDCRGPAGALAQPDKRVEGTRPEGQENGVCGNDPGGQPGARHRQVNDRGPEADTGDGQPAAGQEQEKAGKGVEDVGGQTDREIRQAKQAGRSRNDPRDQGWFRKIAPVETLRPNPVLRLVGVKIDGADGERDDPENRDRGNEDEPGLQPDVRPRGLPRISHGFTVGQVGLRLQTGCRIFAAAAQKSRFGSAASTRVVNRPTVWQAAAGVRGIHLWALWNPERACAGCERPVPSGV